MDGVAVEVAHFTVELSTAHSTDASDPLYDKLRLFPFCVICTWQVEPVQVAVQDGAVRLHGSEVLSAHNPSEPSETTSVSKTT
jgi:hypothetical protein